MELFGKTPGALGLIHFIGIGGIGMSALAELLHSLGFRVQGSDNVDGSNLKRLRQKGIPVFVGHTPGHVKKAFRVVVSSAVSTKNSEYIAAQEMGIRILHRSELLAEILKRKKSVAVSGTHGKTTVTNMIHTLLMDGGLAPSLVSGGVSLSYGSNMVAGKGEWVVAEADESDGSFIRYVTDYAVVTNIEAEHMNHYGDMENLLQSYRVFLDKSKDGGVLILCADHPETFALAQYYEEKHKVITYGASGKVDADVKALRIRHAGSNMVCDVHIGNDVHQDVSIRVLGDHNVQNAMAAVAVAHDMGISFDDIRKGLLNYKGVRRRFNNMGGGRGIVVIDDYAHHPTEIRATLKAAKDVAKGRVIAVIQPHRYSRLKDMMDGFSQSTEFADKVVVLPVYASGEHEMVGVNHYVLAERIKKERSGMFSRAETYTAEVPADLCGWVDKNSKKGDVVVCMGAGNVDKWASLLAKHLQD